MDYEKLKEVIVKQIKENGRGEITGPVLQAVLMAMVDSLGEVYPQTYTDEQKAQARANIDALSNYDGEITKEKLSAEVQAILNDVANKQNITDESLATIAKTIVGAINEVYKGGLEDGSISTSKIEDGAVTTEKLKDQAVEYAKLSASIRSTLDMVEAKIKVLSSGTDLKAVTEAGIYILSGTATYLNAPHNWEHYNTAILIVTGDNSNSFNRGKTIIGFQDGSRYPFAATLRDNEWTETDLDTALKGKLDNTSTLTDTEINSIWDNN